MDDERTTAVAPLSVSVKPTDVIDTTGANIDDLVVQVLAVLAEHEGR